MHHALYGMTRGDVAVLIGGLGAGLVVGSVANDLFGSTTAVAFIACIALLAVFYMTRRRRR